MMQKKILRLFVMAGLAAIVAGCSDPTVGIVSGTVTIDGQPAKEGGITYIPLEKGGRTAGAQIKDGKYSGELMVGNYKVEMRVPKKVGETKIYDTPDSPIQPVLKEVLPAKYNDFSELTLEVPSGKSEKNWEFKLTE